jgi:Rieske Fe-S protein
LHFLDLALNCGSANLGEKTTIRTFRFPLANLQILLYSPVMKRREALSLIAGSALALIPISSTSANQKRKTIYCMRNGKVRKVTGVNPSCPVGWKKTTAKQGKAALKAQQKPSKPTAPSTDSGSGSGSGNASPSVPNNWIKLTTLAALPTATATRFANQNVWVIKDGNNVTGFSGQCTHEGISVVARGAGFFCPGHGATYDKNGLNPTSPAPRPLARAKFEVVNGDVYLVP